MFISNKSCVTIVIRSADCTLSGSLLVIRVANTLFFTGFWVSYQCLKSIQLIIDEYSYVMRLGWLVSRFFHPRAKLSLHCCSGLGSSDTHLWGL